MKTFLPILLSLLLITSCTANNKKNEFKQDFQTAKAGMQFPIDVGAGMMITDIQLDEKDWTVHFIVQNVPNFIVDQINKHGGMEEDNKLLLLSTYSQLMSPILENELGFKWSLTSINGEKAQLAIPYEEAFELNKTIEKQNIVSPTLIQLFQQQIDQYTFPVEVAQGMNLINAYTDEHNATYVYQFAYPIDKSQITEQSIHDYKQANINSLKPMLENYMGELKVENITIHYIFKDMNGDELYNISITCDDFQ